MRVERIFWDDSGFSHDAGWETLASMMSQFEPSKMATESVGWVATESDDVVGLVHTRSIPTDMYIGIHWILKKCITKREVLLDDDVDQHVSDRQDPEGISGDQQKDYRWDRPREWPTDH